MAMLNVKMRTGVVISCIYQLQFAEHALMLTFHCINLVRQQHSIVWSVAKTVRHSDVSRGTTSRRSCQRPEGQDPDMDPQDSGIRLSDD